MSVYAEPESFGNTTGAELVELNGKTFVKLTTSYEYDKEGRLTKETAPDGTETTYRYDSVGNCVEIKVTGKSGASKTESRTYDALGNVTKETDAKGNVTTYTYNSIGKLIEAKDAEGGISLYLYDYAGNLIAETSGANYESYKEVKELPRLKYTYDSMGRVSTVSEVEDAETLIATYTYDKNGNLLTATDANGNTTTYTYTAAGKVATVQTPEAAEAGKSYAMRYTYDALGRVLTEENALGGKVTYTYDGVDNVLTVTKGKATTTYTYDGAGNVLTETTEAGLVTTNTYNAIGLLLTSTVTGAEGMDAYSETYRYDLAGQLVSTANSMGVVATNVYDTFGNLVRTGVADVNGENYRGEKYTYDANGNILMYTNAENVTTTYTYDALNRVTSETVTVSGKDQIVSTEYDENGNKVAETDIFGNTTTYFYDAFDRRTKVVSADGVVLVSYIYDPAGNCISQTDALGNVTAYEYNGGGQVTKTTDACGNTTVNTYDALGNVAAATDGEGNKTTYTYDGFGNLLTVTTADGVKTTYEYDASGNLTKQTDGAGNVTSYTYNAANLVLTKTESGTVVATYTYNGDGSTATMTDANGTVNIYVYNVHGELVSETATGANGAKSTYTYTYNRVGDLTSMTDGSGTTTYTYDELGRVISKDAPNFGKVTYTYDLISGMDEGYHYELQTDSTGTTKTVYDRQNRIASVSTSTGERTDVAEISYYDNGARKQVTYADGSSEYYTFYGNNLVKGVTNKLADDTVIDQFSYVYDGAGNLKSKIELANGVMRGETTYTYDKQNRLVSVTNPDGSTTTYTYDKAGNRATETTVENGVETVKTYTYNGRNQLLTVEQTIGGVAVSRTTYTYDANGNQLSEVETQNDVSVTKLTNTYDLRNQLICSATEDAVINNTYNASGYRVAKVVTKDGKTSKTYFLYDGGSVTMEADEDGVTAKNTYGGPLLFRTVFGDIETTYQYMYNAHGDVVTLLTDGEVAATYCYDSFGNVLEQTGEVDNSILYAGYQYDEETGLYYINARMYDPVTARFLQADTYLGNTSDPLSLNLYTYCLNNPHKYTDPSGHFVITAAAVLLAARIVTSLVSGVLSAKAEYDRQVAEGDNYADWASILFVGGANAGLSFATFGIGSGAVKGAGVGAKLLFKHLGKAVVRDAAIGALMDAGIETARQLVTGTKITNLEYDRIKEAGVMGGIIGGGSTIAGAALEGLMKTRVAQKALVKLNAIANKGANAIKSGFAKVAGKSEKSSVREVTGLGESRFKLNLQFFADKKGKTSIQAYDVTTYDDFRMRSVVGDGLEGHEIWQHANLKENGYATTRLSTDASKNNIVMALPHDVHVDVNKAQYSLNAKVQSPIENISSNADILYKHNEIPNSQVDRAVKQAMEHYKRVKK